MEVSNTIGKEQKVVPEVSFKDLILKLIDISKYLWRSKFIILTIGIIGAGIGFLVALKTKPTYKAQLTFILEESGSNPLGSYMGLASQFGLDLGSKGNSGVFEGDNIIEFLKSRLMVEKALLSGVVVNGKEMSIAELYLDTYQLRQTWEKDPQLKNLTFPLQQERKTFTRQQDSVLNDLQSSMVLQHMSVSKPDKKLSFISVECTTLDEVLSKAFAETIVRVATAFYVDTKTMRTKSNVERLQTQADSMEILLNRKTYATAISQDINQNPARQIASVKTELVMRDKMVLQTMYGEIVKNLEMSKIAMAQETPVIQIIDTPIFPLQKKKFGKLKGIILGGLIGGFLSVMVLIGRKLIKEEMS